MCCPSLRLFCCLLRSQYFRSREPLRTLLRNLNEWRRKAGKEFLLYGRMEKPYCRVHAPEYALPSLIAGRDLVTSSVLSSAWSAPNGDKAQFLVNFMPHEQQLEIEIPPENRLNEIFAVNLRTVRGWTPELWAGVPNADSWEHRIAVAQRAAAETFPEWFDISPERITLSHSGLLFWNSVAETIL